MTILLYTSALRIALVDYDNREDCTVLTGDAAKIVAWIERKHPCFTPMVFSYPA